jgi:hypothetical protein
MNLYNFKDYKKVLVLLLGYLCLCNLSLAAPVTYYFSQSFSQNGLISGNFSGEDLFAPNGKISGDDNFGEHGGIGPAGEYELNNFSLTFTGNTFFRKFNCDSCQSLQKLEYDIANNTLMLSVYANKSENNGYWLENLVTGFPNYSDRFAGAKYHYSDAFPFALAKFLAVSPMTVTQTPPLVTPIPGAVFLFGSGLAGLAVLTKRKTIDFHQG